ncbi:hypothetical protein GCM10027181_18260 [Rheinheimera gaetbuli]
MSKHFAKKALLMLIVIASLVWYWHTYPEQHTFIMLILIAVFVYSTVVDSIRINRLEDEIDQLKTQLSKQSYN